MRYTDYDEAEKHDGQLWRIDVVLFNVDHDYFLGDQIDGEYCDMGGGFHPFECFFTDLDEAKAYAATFTADMAMHALDNNGNVGRYENVAVEVNELDEMDPGYVVACHEWYGGFRHEYWED